MTALTEIRAASEQDLSQIMQLEQHFSSDPSHWATPEQLLARIRKFPAGFLLGFHHETLITMLNTCLVSYDPENPTHFSSWANTTNAGYFYDTPVEKPNCLYIVSGTIDRAHRNESYMTYAYQHLLQLAQELGVSYVVAGASLIGYARYVAKNGFVPAREYAFMTRRGRCVDPLLERYRQIGFSIPNRQHVRQDYFEHAGSMNWAGLVVYPIEGKRSDLVVNFSDPNFVEDPYPIYQAMRQQQPVYKNDLGVYYLTRHDHCNQLLTDKTCLRQPQHDAALLGDMGEIGKEADEFLRGWLLFQDPPLHTQTRELLAKAMKLGEIKHHEAAVRKIAKNIIEPLAAKPTVEVMHELAVNFSMQVTCHFLGVPLAHIDLYVDFIDAIMLAGDEGCPEKLAAIIPLAKHLAGLLSEVVAQKLATPTNDWLSHLLQINQQQVEPRSMEDIISLCLFVLQATSNTPRVYVGNALYSLLRQPHQWRRLCQLKTVGEDVTDELLRIESPGNKISRWTSCERIFGETTIPKNSLVVSLLNAANHDDSIFPFPEELHFNRKNQRQIAFGRGIHTCIGSALVKLESTVLLETLIQFMPNISITEGGITWMNITSERHLKSLIVQNHDHC